MQSQVHEVDPVTVEVEVEIPWDRIQKGLDAGYGKLQRTTKVRGFRPGKVPRNVLKQLFGAQVRSEVVAAVVQEGLIEAVEAHAIPLVASPRVDRLPTIEEGSALSFKATMEVRPKVEAIDLDGLVVERPAPEVTEAQVDEEIERLRERQAEIVTPDPMRPAQLGDLLTIDYVVEVDDEEKPDMAATGRVVEVGGGRLLPEFEEGLLGGQPGDEMEIRVAYGEDAQIDELKNRRVLFRVTVRELREKVLPDLDDEFAKDQGEHETLADLRADVRRQLQEAAAQRADSDLREKLVEKLVEKNPVPVPPSLLTQQVQAMQRELSFLVQMAGQAGQDLAAEMTDSIRKRAEHKVQAGILMGELARQQSMTVDAEEIEARMAKIAEQTGKHIAKVRVEYAGERREALESKILEDKLLDYLLSRATVTEAPAAPAGEAGAGQDG